MTTRTVHDPFLGEDVQVSNKLTDRLRGRYAAGPTMPNGEPEFGWRQHDTPPIQHEAANCIDALESALWMLIDNVKTGSYESTLQAIAAIEAAFAPEQNK